MPGLGLFPLGLVPFGFGLESTAAADPSANPALRGARKIDPYTRDYVLDAATRRFEQTTAAEQVLRLKLGAKKGSGIGSPNYGVGAPDDITDATPREQERRIRDAMAPDVAAGCLTLDDVRVTVAESGLIIEEVDFIPDTGDPDTVTV